MAGTERITVTDKNSIRTASMEYGSDLDYSMTGGTTQSRRDSAELRGRMNQMILYDVWDESKMMPSNQE